MGKGGRDRRARKRAGFGRDGQRNEHKNGRGEVSEAKQNGTDKEGENRLENKLVRCWLCFSYPF